MIRHFILVILLATLSACGSTYSGSFQKDDSLAYLQLEGEFMGTTLQIDDGAKVFLNKESVETYEIDNKQVALFEIPRGSHRIKIFKQGKLIVDRKMFVSAGNTFEVKI